MVKYVPILKYKKGEQDALLNLAENIKDTIIPLIEIPISALNSTKKKSIDYFWKDRKFFFYFTPEWYYDDITGNYDIDNALKNDDFKSMCENRMGIPVVDLSYLNITSAQKWRQFSDNGIGIRVRNNEYAIIESNLNPLFNSGYLDRQNTYLILDLQYCSADDLFAKTSVLKAAFSDLDCARDYRSIIISSVSFPKQLPPMESNKIYRFQRIETEIYTLAQKLSNRFGFKYTYSDYGPTDIEDVQFIVGMSPNFKIKYTTFENYVYIKGLSIKRGGLDIDKVQDICKILVDSSEFSGENYSWGDNKIYQLSQNALKSPGNLTNWVSYAMNHHITFISHQI